MTRMSVNINGGVELGGLLTIEHLQDKNKNKPVKGQKLSALKNAVTLKKKSADGSSDAGEVKLLRRVDEEPQADRKTMKTEARVQTASVGTAAKAAKAVKAARTTEAAKMATREDLYASLTKKDAADNAAYEVDGVRFSAEEMKSMREALGDVFTSVKRPGSSIDYSDYAKMGIAENVARAYAEKNLSTEQTEVLMKAVSEHMDQVIAKEPEASFIVEDCYYGTRYSGGVWDELKQYAKDMVAKSDLPAQTKRVFAEKKVDSPGMAMSASNTKLASTLRSRFSTLDFGNEDELQSFFKQYQDWMKPAYLEVHGGSENFAAEHIAEDITMYKKSYEKLWNGVLAASMPHVDLHI